LEGNRVEKIFRRSYGEAPRDGYFAIFAKFFSSGMGKPRDWKDFETGYASIPRRG